MKQLTFRRLDPKRIIETSQILFCRISERFPDSGLSKIALELHSVTKEAAERSQAFHRPLVGVRMLAAALVILILSILGWLLSSYHEFRVKEFGDFIQTLEAGTSSMVFIAATVWFLLTLEKRQKKLRALAAIRELHSLAHIVDMHQLTKDPDHYLFKNLNTPSSPKRSLNPHELSRYLDYCNEILALLGKISAIYTEFLDDSEVLSSTDQLEGLLLGLSTKISNKLSSIERIELSKNSTSPHLQSQPHSTLF